MPAAVEWLNEFQVNSGSAATGGQSDPKIIGLSNGNILVAWVENGNGTVGGLGDSDVIGKIFNAEGGLVRNSFLLSLSGGPEETFHDDFDIAATNDGGFVIVYTSRFTSVGVDVHTIDWERHDAAGNQTSFRRIASETDDGEFYSDPQITFNQQTGQSLITGFHYNVEFTGVDVDRYAWTVSAGGTVTGIGAAGDNKADDMVEGGGGTALLTNGNFVSVYTELDDDFPGIEARIGTSSGSQIRLWQVAAIGNEPQVASLIGGGFVITARDNDGFVYFQVFENDGIPRSSLHDVLPWTPSHDTMVEPTIVALTDGDFVIAWRNVTDGTIEARRFNPDGTLLAGQEEVFVVATGVRADPKAAITGDGRILFTWQHGNGEIFSSIWDPRPDIIRASEFERNLPNFVNSDVFTAGPQGSDVFGDNADNLLVGQGGDDLLEGGQGTDTVRGGGGRDTIRIRNLDQIDHVDGGAGIDTLTMSGVTSAGGGARIYMGDNVFNGFGVGTTIRNVENVLGTQLGDTIVAADGINVLLGLGGGDNLQGGRGIDTVSGGIGSDVITIGDGEEIDHVFGDGDHDYLLLSGIQSTGQQVVIDLAAATFDGLGGRTGISGIEEIYATQLQDVVRGNDLANVFHGEGGADTLLGRGGKDFLDGGTGADRLEGGAHNDTYVVDNTGDRAIESAGEGTDQVQSAVTFTLGSNIENLTLTGSAAINGVGNSLANSIVGNSAANSLNGGAGDDQLFGGIGNDSLRGSAGADRFDGGAGIDSLNFDVASSTVIFLDGSGTNAAAASGDTFANIENIFGSIAGSDFLTGDAGANRFLGNGGNDRLAGRDGIDQLEGGAGNDRLAGEQGNDVLVGGADADTFVFNLTPAAGGLDRTNDFVHLQDDIEIDASVFGGGLVASAAVQFTSGPNPTAAGLAGGVFLYDTDDGFLRFDADGQGAGAAVAFFRIQNLPALTGADFIVVA